MKTNLKQVIDKKYCLRCDICCRFLSKDTYLQPLFTVREATKIKKLKPRFAFIKDEVLCGCSVRLARHNNGFRCPFFSASKNLCKIYQLRPLDCRIYPFVLMFDRYDEKVSLGADTKCPYIQDILKKVSLKKYVLYLKKFFQTKEAIALLSSYPNLISRFQEDVFVLSALKNLTNHINKNLLNPLRRMSVLDKTTIRAYLSGQANSLCAFSFNHLIIWSGLFSFYWRIIDSNLCVFAQEHGNFFMFLPPLGKKISKKAVTGSFKIMDALNKNKQISRIENVPESLLGFFKDAGFKPVLKETEYICDLETVVHPRGNKFKSKRWGYNYFIKNYGYVYRPYVRRDKKECLALYKKWQDIRRQKFPDTYYQALLADTYFALKKAQDEYEMLDLTGRVVEVDKKICGFIFGYRLNDETLCVAFETTDLSKKGLSQFIFKRFAEEFFRTASSPFKHINIMGDCGLENLKVSKLSWHPRTISSVYVINKK